MADLGLTLKELRDVNNYTQMQVANKLNVSSATVIRWENNYKAPSTSHLIDLAVLYNVPLDYLIGREKEKSIVIGRLTKNQQTLIKMMVLEFENNDNISEKMTQRQQSIINLLFQEFNR